MGSEKMVMRVGLSGIDSCCGRILRPDDRQSNGPMVEKI